MPSFLVVRSTPYIPYVQTYNAPKQLPSKLSRKAKRLSFAFKMPNLYILGAVAALTYGVFRLLSIGKRPKGYPPGPPTLPVIGNIHLVGLVYTWPACPPLISA